MSLDEKEEEEVKRLLYGCLLILVVLICGLDEDEVENG